MSNKKVLTKEQKYLVGRWDGTKFYIHDYYHTDTSRSIRGPSRKWPYSEWKHISTSKYYDSLSEDQLATLNKVYIGI